MLVSLIIIYTNVVENSAIIRNLENIFSTWFLFLRKSNLSSYTNIYNALLFQNIKKNRHNVKTLKVD